MPFIHVRVVAGVFTAQQKREIVERLTEAMVAIQGEGMRQLTWCVVEEVPSGVVGHRWPGDHRGRREGDRARCGGGGVSGAGGVPPAPPAGAAPARTLRVAASGTLLVLAVFSAFVVTVGDSARSLGAGIGGQAWALSGMSLGLAGALLTAGVVADDLGYGRVLTWSAGILVVASVVGALAPSMPVLITARVLQGLAGGGVLAASLGAIGRAFPTGASRTRATAIWGAAVGAGITAGPLTAAALRSALGWRSGFWVEAGAAVALMIAARGFVTASGSRRPSRRTGMATLTPGWSLLTGALVEAHHGWCARGPRLLLAAGVA